MIEVNKERKKTQFNETSAWIRQTRNGSYCSFHNLIMWHWKVSVIGWICRRSETNGPCQKSIHKCDLVDLPLLRVNHDFMRYATTDQWCFVNEKIQLSLERESFILLGEGPPLAHRRRRGGGGGNKTNTYFFYRGITKRNHCKPF